MRSGHEKSFRVRTVILALKSNKRLRKISFASNGEKVARGERKKKVDDKIFFSAGRLKMSELVWAVKNGDLDKVKELVESKVTIYLTTEVPA